MTARVAYIWHDRMDWCVKTDGGQYWHRPVDRDDWRPGVPPGMSLEDLALFDLPCPTGLPHVA